MGSLVFDGHKRVLLYKHTHNTLWIDLQLSLYILALQNIPEILILIQIPGLLWVLIISHHFFIILHTLYCYLLLKIPFYLLTLSYPGFPLPWKTYRLHLTNLLFDYMAYRTEMKIQYCPNIICNLYILSVSKRLISMIKLIGYSLVMILRIVLWFRVNSDLYMGLERKLLKWYCGELFTHRYLICNKCIVAKTDCHRIYCK